MADGTTDAAQAVASSCVLPDGSANGMPQLCTEWFTNQIFWLVIALVAIFLILSRIALPRIATVLAQRAGSITNDIAAAEDLRLKAAAAEAAYQKALSDARAEANRIIAEARAGIQAQLDVELQKADAEIAARTAESERLIGEIRAQAVDSVSAVARDTARAIVTALGGTVDEAAVDAAVDQRVRG